jgi:hypothetical protein
MIAHSCTERDILWLYHCEGCFWQFPTAKRRQALVALGRVRQRARTGASIAGFPGSVSPGWRR